MTSKESKTVLILAPIPPPTDGQSKISKRVNDILISGGLRTIVINMNRRDLRRSMMVQLKRIVDILLLYRSIFIKRNKSDDIYISLSESTLGNIKDIIIYILLLGNIEKITLHMLGGAGMDRIINKTRLLSILNGYFLKRVKRLIVEGDRGKLIFKKYVNINKIHRINNCVEKYLFVENHIIHDKFRGIDKIQILYLSNMIVEKGYLNLLEAFYNLPDHIASKVNIVFVGGFQLKSDEIHFKKRINGNSSIEYLGNFIDGDDKYRLYCRSHVFCLPTYYSYEGQPISILEAYATGCAVITTLHAGIPDIFCDGVNGYSVETNNILSISSVIERVVLDRTTLEAIALRNRSEAFKKYHPDRFDSEILAIFNNGKM